MAGALLDDARGRRALIAGAGGGIGGAAAQMFASAGADVIAVDLETPKSGSGIRAIACDVASEADVTALFADIENDGAGLDYLINAAGIARTAKLAQTSLTDWNQVLEANLTSCFLLARAAHRLLTKPGGSVVFCGSSNGMNGGSYLSGAAYASAKAGVHNLTRYLAKEWASDGIRINAVAPGPIDTPMIQRFDDATRDRLRQAIPLGRDGTPQDVATNIAFLCSRHAAWQTGTIVNISGGLVL